MGAILPPPLGAGGLYLYGYARDAVVHAVRALAPAGATWLCPGWVCDVLPRAIEAAGARVAWYDVDDRPGAWEPDLAAIERGLAAGARGVVLVHYFGFPAPLERAIAAARAAGAAVIEDCAGAAFSRGPSGWAGAAGDAAVFSFRKCLPLPNGAALAVAAGDAAERVRAAAPARLRRAARVGPWARETWRWLRVRVGRRASRQRAMLESIAPDARPIDRVPEAIHPAAEAALRQWRGEAWAEERRARYDALARAARETLGLDVAAPARVAEGVLPFGVPVRHPRPRAAAEALRMANVPCGVWPEPIPAIAAGRPPMLLLRLPPAYMPLDPVIERARKALRSAALPT